MKFKEFYAEHSHLNNIRESLSLLFKNIFPLMEFSGALVYTIDNLSQMLTPRLKVGAVQLRELKPIPVAELKLDHDPVASAFQCAAPLSGHSQGQRVSYMACRLGGERAAPIGVLYVEVSTDLLSLK